MRITSY